ncbi:MAG: aspartyl protease family protein [Woeseiaceae bacterium]
MKLKRTLVCLAPIFLLWGCATVLDEDGALAIVPYSIQENGRIVVNARVNGYGPFVFALDTGATISVIFDKLRGELALEPLPGSELRIHGMVGSGVFPLLDVSNLAVGREVWPRPRIASLPGDTVAGATIDGILGVDFLRRYAVGFSAQDRVIRLYPPELVAGRAYQGWTSISLQPERLGDSSAALYLFAIEIGSHRIPAIFDLGAGVNLLNHAAVESMDLKAAYSRDKQVLSGAIESAQIAARFRIKEVKSGRARWRNEAFEIIEEDIFDSLMEVEVPYAILGAGLFTQRDFIIDFNRNRLLVKFAMDELDPLVSDDG